MKPVRGLCLMATIKEPFKIARGMYCVETNHKYAYTFCTKCWESAMKNLVTVRNLE
jgi:hypothetical protein